MKHEHSRTLTTLCILLAMLSGILLLSGCTKEKINAATASKEFIAVKNEVPRVGPYSQMIRAGGFVFCSAQAAFDPGTGKLVAGDITAQTRQIFQNFAAELADAGLTLNDAVSVTVYLTDMSLFKEMNAAYATFFSEPYPVRACVEVSDLPVEGALLTIQLTAVDR